MGIKPNQDFVCFVGREKEYLNKVNSKISLEEWSYHDYRDCQINNYLGAAKYLSDQGVYAIRMGYLMESALAQTNSFIIDYANHYRTELGDIFLSAKCKFFLGSTTGLCCLPLAFSRPIAFANYIPIGFAPLQRFDLFIVKKLWSIQDRRFITFKEIIEGGLDQLDSTGKFGRTGLEVIENTEEEILDLAKEMNERIDGKWITLDEDEELQKRFRALFPKGHRCHRAPSRLGVEFLRQNRELLS